MLTSANCCWLCTSSGVVLSASVSGSLGGGSPWASLPSVLSPQHQSLPRSVSAQVLNPPQRMLANGPARTSVGSSRGLRSPTPSSPCALLPQHSATPSLRNAQLWCSPAQTSLNDAV